VNMQPAIYVEDLWKRYVLLHSRPRRIKDAVLRRLLGRHSSREEFWALRGVSFEVAAGEAIGIIGPNGSGKSTVLGVLSRLLRPTKGVVQVQGRVGALLEASAGFHPDLTGIENVQMIASLMGLSRKETLARLPAIMEFAGAREFMDAAVRTYSTGMFARLAFSRYWRSGTRNSTSNATGGWHRCGSEAAPSCSFPTSWSKSGAFASVSSGWRAAG